MKPDTDFSIRTILGGYDRNFTYIITCMRTGMQICVDAAVEQSSIEPYIRSEPAALLVTHTHGDHIAFLDEYLEHNVICHQKCYKYLCIKIKDLVNLILKKLIYFH